MNRKEIIKYIKQKYNIEPVNLWRDKPDFIVFRNMSKKWFAIIMNVSYNKMFGTNNNEKIIDVMNVKLEPEMVCDLQRNDGFAKAYHINKTHWITISLEQINITQAKSFIDISYNMVK